MAFLNLRYQAEARFQLVRSGNAHWRFSISPEAFLAHAHFLSFTDESFPSRQSVSKLAWLGRPQNSIRP
jgi:hypothetical protein